MTRHLHSNEEGLFLLDMIQEVHLGLGTVDKRGFGLLWSTFQPQGTFVLRYMSYYEASLLFPVTYYLREEQGYHMERVRDGVAVLEIIGDHRFQLGYVRLGM